jgi:ATP-binding cassette subfamily B protein
MNERALVWSWLKAVWRDSPLALGTILVLSVGSAGLLTAFPWLWQYVVDEVRGSADPATLYELGGWMMLVGFAQFFLYMVLQGTRSVMNARIQWRARERVFEHLSRLDPAFYRRWRSGDLVTRLYDDAGDKIAWFLCSGVFRAYEAALIVTVCLGAMLWLDWRLTFWVALPLPLLMAGQAIVQGALGRRYLAVQQSISGINDELTSTFQAIRVVQAADLVDAASDRFGAGVEAQRSAEVRTAVFQQGVFLLYGFGWQTAVVALLIAGGQHVIDGTLTVGRFVTFEGFVMTLVWPMFDFGMFVSKYKQAGVALRRLQVLLDEPVDPMVGEDPPPTESSIGARSVQVVAQNGDVLLDDVELTVAPGERVAIVGTVGAGKSTMMAVLAGLRRAALGDVLIGGIERARLDRGAVRREVALVPQDPVLLSASVRDNILLGREVEQSVMALALDVSRLAQDLPALTDGLDTLVGERGVTLSGGQQQRVALARALVGSPSILLLDDATAALDADTEAMFWQRLEDALPGLTAVVVTHRVATIRKADRVVVLEDGRVRQRGSHDDLVGLEGPYARIYGRMEAVARLA